jgi:V/A-type H+-transporting ATPase subunit D
MKGAAVRSRLLLLRRHRDAARRGHELLEQKHEVLLREWLRRTPVLAQLREQAAVELARARARLREAQVEIGEWAADAAALAQPEIASVEVRDRTLLGVAVPALRGRVAGFRPSYATGGTAASLDRAGAAFAGLLSRLIRLAEEDLAVRNLKEGLTKTTRRLRALEKVVLPDLEREIREVTAALEEDERDESFRRKRWLSAR